jgi:KinB signaling pathway activation protein
MNLRKFWMLFFTTACVGMLLGALTAVVEVFHISLQTGIITGGFLSATTMMGFWAYLTLNFTMRNFVSFRIWLVIQLLLIGLVFYDLIYFRYMITGNGEGSFLPYLGYALWPMGVALIGAFFKGRISGMRNFIPTVFFLFVMTTVEWFVALKSGAMLQATQIGVILLGCNLYILFMYTRLLAQPTHIKSATVKQPSPAK